MLPIILLFPILGAIAIAVLPKNKPGLVRLVANTFSVATLLIAWGLLFEFDTTLSSLQFYYETTWNQRLGTYFALGVDGFSFPMVLLATLLCSIAILTSASIKHKVRSYFALMLVLESAILGVFMAQDWSLFYVFWEMTLIPLFFLIDRWGGKNRQQAALNFVLYTMGGSVFMLVALLVIFDNLPAHSFLFSEMAKGVQSLPDSTQTLLFLGLLIGFGVKMPIFPIHGWLPIAHVEAPAPVSILLSGILLKMGAYGLIRAATMLPEAVLTLQNMLAGIGLFSLIYGGLLAWRQADLKAMIAYSSISHMGIVLLGIAALNTAGLTGAVSQMIAHGLVAAALFLLIGLLYERTHYRNINDYSALLQVAPKFAFLTSIVLLASIGLPGSVGFIAELHTIIGGFMRWNWLMLIVSFGVLISAAYAIRTITRLITGRVSNTVQDIQDLQTSELIAAGSLITGIIWLGLLPSPMIELMSASITQFDALFRAN
jgi:NADH-quinone oxidoreductase subunit M